MSDLRQWTWAWAAPLGAIEVASKPVTVKYPFPSKQDREKLPGLHPY